jgi:hypothetical protein
VRRILTRVVDDLRRVADPSLEGVVVAVGADDPGLARRLPPGPRVVVPALRGRSPSPFAHALLATAAATVAIDPGELPGLAGAVRGPLVMTGIPRPEPGPPAEGVDPGDTGARLTHLWTAEVGPLPAEGAAVCWVAGPAALAGAVDAWARGAAVVALPGAAAHAMMRRGGALMSRTSLEALEATRLLHATRPLARALARRGRHEAMRLDPIEVVSGRFAEALVLAAEGA